MQKNKVFFYHADEPQYKCESPRWRAAQMIREARKVRANGGHAEKVSAGKYEIKISHFHSAATIEVSQATGEKR